MLVEYLREIQRLHGYLPETELKALSERESIPLYLIHSVASFYSTFKFKPPPKATFKICTDLSCHLHGACDILETLEETANLAGLVDWEILEQSCLGQCDGAPAISVNNQIYRNISVENLGDFAESLISNHQLPHRPINRDVNKGVIDPYNPPLKNYSLNQWASGTDPDWFVNVIKESGLFGMGGAGFPTGLKWELVRKTQAATKYVICNADESEPGTFKDREILRHYSHLIIEGMILGGLVIGATQGYIFLRHEYQQEREILLQTIKTYYSEGYLGDRILDTDSSFHLNIFDSPGGYICGEETALLEAIEGKRAEPRNKPPFPGTDGLHGCPTLINNVETFAWIPSIIKRGGQWFKSHGVNNRQGLKYIALSGHIEKPGVYEIPLGIRIIDLIQEYGGGVSGGRQLKAFSPGGISSGFLPAKMSDISVDLKSLSEVGSMLGSGGIIVIAEGTDMVDLVRNTLRFFRNESCGKCVPCRVGTDYLVQASNKILESNFSSDMLNSVKDISETMELTSICGLGQAAPKPLLSAIEYFPDEFEKYGVNIYPDFPSDVGAPDA